ncbi:hypothetical protein HKD37_12G034354 [Glycine soja]
MSLTHDVTPKHNLFDEEVLFEEINQNMDDWSILEIPQDTLYVPETTKNKHNFDYIIKTKIQIPTHRMCLVETSLGQGSVYFNCYPNKMVSLMDKNILDSLFLNIHFHGLDMKEGSVPAALINRIQVLLKPQKGDTTLFIIDMTKANVFLPRTIKWDEATLPEKWVMDKATPSVPRLGPTIEQIKQDNSGKETLRKDFYSPENEPKRRWFFQHFKGFKRQQIQDKFYKFVEKIKINIPFFDWFHAYTIKENINYPWKQDIIGDPTTNVFTNWQIKDGELIQLELPPTTQYQLPKVKDSSDKPVMATPFKTKDVNEEITPKDIRSLMEQAYYTNKYLQVIGETISKEKISTKPKDHECSTSNVPIEKPLFKPFKVNEKAKQKFRELRKSRSPTEEVSDSNSELLSKINKQVTEEGSISEKDINPINTKHWKIPSKFYYQRPTAPDNLLEERDKNNFKSFSAHNIYEWNIDAQIEYNIMNTHQHMIMVATTYQTSHECTKETIVDILDGGIIISLMRKNKKIYSAIKIDLNGKFITNDDNESAELLSNLKCRTLADFRWYRDTFLTRVYTREDSQQSFWKEKFLVGLLRLLGDKIRDKIRSQSVNGDIPYDNLSYGQLISYVQKLALKICQDDKIQRQLAKEKAQTKRDLGSFCEKFGLPACPKQKKKQNPKKEFHENKNSNKRIFPNRKYSYKPSTNKDTNMPKTVMKPRTKVVCYNCGKQGHISKYCRLKRKLRNLNLDPFIEEQINNLLIETSEEESGEASSEENLNQIQQDDQPSSTDEQDIQEVKTLTKEHDLFVLSNQFHT